MKLTRYFWLFSFGCTDYKLNNVNTPTSGAEEEAVTENTTTETDTATTEITDTSDPAEEEDDCTESYINFDIEEVSTLQDAVSYSVAGWNQDAVVLQFDDSNLQPEQTWRVSAVEILVMIAADHYPNFVDGQQINVQVFDSNEPTNSNPWTATKSIVRAEHNWTDYTLPHNAWYAGTYGEYAQKGSWVRFDMRSSIPQSGMTSPEFITGVMWEAPGMVKVGYSNFNQDCEKNWTNYGSGWGLNS